MWIIMNRMNNGQLNLLNSIKIRRNCLFKLKDIFGRTIMFKNKPDILLYNNLTYTKNLENVRFITNNRRFNSKGNIIANILNKSRIIDDKEVKTIGIVSKYLWPKNMEYRKRIILSLISLGIAKLATIQVPLLLSRLIDSLGIMSSSEIPYSFANKLNVFFLISSYGIARISSSGFNELRNALFSKVSQAACKDISLKAFYHFHNTVDLNFIQNHRSGELLTIITRGFKSVSQLLNIMIFQIIPTTAEFILVLGILLKKVGFEAALITLSTMIAYMDFTRRVTHKRTIYRKNMNNSEQRSNGILSDSLINAETLKYLNSEKYIYDLYSKYQQYYINSNIKVQTSLAFLNFGQNCIFTGGLLSTMLLTTNKILSGQIPIGSIVLVTSLLFQLAIPLNHIGVIYRETKLTMIDLNKLDEYLTIKENKNNKLNNDNLIKKNKNINPIDLYKNINLQQMNNENKNSIKLENISFGFPLILENKNLKKTNVNKKMIINDLSLEIPLGKKMGIVGSSGSGKTTLSKLIFRIFDPIDGNISIFNKNIKDFEMKEYRKCFSILPQDILLLNMSIIDNLKLANNNTKMDEIIAACKLAGIHENIIKMNNGYETIVGERGCTLSGGEKQRLGFARLLIKKSPIWILDEPTSALDLINHNFLVKMLTNMHSHSILNQKSNNKIDKYQDIFDLIKSKNTEKQKNDIINLIDQIIQLPLTIIVIAHRLSTVKNFDLIAYLEDGNVKEIGNHEDLIKNKMHYYQLWNKQYIDNILK